ncbi:MAG: hypothetical protein WAV48_04220, partial [Candidatus Magasanikiibacteriota bacterium]
CGIHSARLAEGDGDDEDVTRADAVPGHFSDLLSKRLCVYQDRLKLHALPPWLSCFWCTTSNNNKQRESCQERFIKS